MSGRTVTVTFEGTRFEGLELVCLTTVSERLAAAIEHFRLPGAHEHDAACYQEVLDAWPEHLVSWNFEENGVPVPVTADAYRKLGIFAQVELCSRWQQQMLPTWQAEAAAVGAWEGY